ncbi:TonB-dependent receptor [Erythrobacter sp. SCSIO 43205]|uniref:TonB-dependent receptor domain-containing protein n=1 Tax=Erythrobacter sp. SCSIO 43205 TaxID=2779361 RepID=UPI001CA8A480|nr:TonB-dependent receptor [Erythrobacter sp. SCSIO 43205]UAB78868.1 TonB-dependent receptor [Erythrobacter sp. SCSIO 43205]
MKYRFNTTIGRSALAAALLCAPVTAIAQDGVDAEEQADSDEGRTIVVTGTLIRGTPEDSALPVDIFTNEDLAAEGVTSPLDFIKDIPAVGGVVGDSNQFQVQGLGPVGTINLRGLGPQRTLVLLNGRRTIVSPGDGLVDTNAMPIFALERVELLKDGAAVTYGSDAVAGVANFITRKNFEGVEIQGDYRFIDDSDGDYTASILGGINLGSDVNIMAGFGYRHRSPLAAFDRDFSNLTPDINPSPYSGIVNPAQYFPAFRATGPIRDGDPGTKPNSTLLGGGVQDVGCTELGGFIQAANGRCLYQYTDYNNLVEKQNYYQAYAALNADLDDTTRFNVDVLYSFGELFTRLSPSYPATQGPQGPGLTFNFFVPETNPGYQTFVDQAAAAGTPFPTDAFGLQNGAAIVLYRPFALGGFPLSDEYPFGNQALNENESFRISAGFEKDLGENFTASLQGTYIDSNSTAIVQDTIGVRLQNALDGLGGPDCDVANGTPGQGGCLYFNPFSNAIGGNPVTGQVNPFYVGPDAGNPQVNNNPASVIDYFTEPAASNKQKERQVVVDFLLSGTLDSLDFGAGPVGVGFGAQYRRSEFELRPTFFSSSVDFPCQQLNTTDCPFPLGPFIFQGQLNPADNTQDVVALFTEVQVPVTDQLEVNLALRYEDYGNPIGSTIDPKASFRFEANDWLVLRGSIGTTFRAPLAGQVVPGTQFTNLTGINAAGGFFFPVDRLGNPQLGPESALTYNLGFVVNTGDFNLQVDYFNYDFDGPLTTTPENPIASAVFSGPGGTADCDSPLAGLIGYNSVTCDPTLTASTNLARVTTQFVNGPDTKTNGFDVEASYTFDAGDLALTLGTAFTYIMNFDVDPFVVNGVTVIDAFDAVGFLNADRAQNSLSEIKANTYLNANYGNLNARYTFRYASGLDDDRYDTNPNFGAATRFGEEIPAFTQHDFTVLYDLPFDFADVQLQGSVENIFDEDPPAARLVLGYDPFVGNPLGRVFRVGLKAGF